MAGVKPVSWVLKHTWLVCEFAGGVEYCCRDPAQVLYLVCGILCLQAIADVLYEILATEGFVPLLQSAAFLAVRLHACSAEVTTTLTRAAFLLTGAEDTFCEAAQELVQARSCVLANGVRAVATASHGCIRPRVKASETACGVFSAVVFMLVTALCVVSVCGR